MKIFISMTKKLIRLLFFKIYGLQFQKFGKNNLVWFPVKLMRKKNISIGDNCAINAFVHIWGGGGVEIGNNVMIATHTSITTLTHDYNAESMRFSKIIAKPVNIKDNVWIGSNVVIMPGVTINMGAVVGAGAVVTKDVPENAIVIGNPARIVKFRTPKVQDSFKRFLEEEIALINNELKKNISDEKVLKLIEYKSYIQWMYPINLQYHDMGSELRLQSIDIEKKVEAGNKKQEGDILICSFLMDNGALFEQYIEAISNFSKNFCVIVTSKIDRVKSKKTLELLKKNNIGLLEFSGDRSLREILILVNELIKINPLRIWAHLSPNDVIAISAINKINGTKFYIVGNDHTFWLGKNFFDYFIEFRNFGISLSVERRGIPKEKILHIPFYPIRNEIKFEGFPFEIVGKIIGVAAANLYKFTADPDLRYFNVIKRLLIENENFIFCLCGWGDEFLIKKFIRDNQLENKFYFLGWRKDFYELVGQSDILFESYPMKGGLTPLFATEQKIPVVGIATNDNYSGSLEELLDIDGYKQPTNFDEFYKEAKMLIKNEEYRKWLGEHLSNNNYNKKEFENRIKKIFDNDLEVLKPKTILPLNLNDVAYLQEYLNLNSSIKENVLRNKLFIMKGYLPFMQRLSILKAILLSSNKFKAKEIIRMIIIAIIGK